MPEFKCISCGEVKTAEGRCSCPVCGYTMFEMPYDRGLLLQRQIKDFVYRLRLVEISDGMLEIYREEHAEKGKTERISKAQDDKRFPSFQTIQNYVCSSTKTEMFRDRLNECIQNIQQHLQTTYTQQYQVGLSRVQETITQLDETLKKALAALSVQAVPAALELPTIALNYRETPDEALLPIANDILTDALALSQKIFRFIKQNNIYGTAYRDKPSQCFVKTKKTDYSKKLVCAKELLAQTLAKRYTVDLLSDGYDELSEMLTVLWQAIEVVLCAPILTKSSIFSFDNGVVACNEAIHAALVKELDLRYSEIDAAINTATFLAGKSENAKEEQNK